MAAIQAGATTVDAAITMGGGEGITAAGEYTLDRWYSKKSRRDLLAWIALGCPPRFTRIPVTGAKTLLVSQER